MDPGGGRNSSKNIYQLQCRINRAGREAVPGKHQQGVRSGAGGTCTELSKADPYSGELVSFVTFFFLGWEVGKISRGSFLTILSLFLMTMQEYKGVHHIVFVWGRRQSEYDL